MWKPHIKTAHHYWEDLVKSDDIVIDATCGNGHDTLFLAPLAGTVIAIDIQPEAIENTKNRLLKELPPEQIKRVQFVLGSHETFPEIIKKKSVALIVYNLGYLPGNNNKLFTTQVKTTQKSITEALELVKPGGMISITCYPGHPEGQLEEEMLLEYANTLIQNEWSHRHTRFGLFLKSPSLLLFIRRGAGG